MEPSTDQMLLAIGELTMFRILATTAVVERDEQIARLGAELADRDERIATLETAVKGSATTVNPTAEPTA